MSEKHTKRVESKKRKAVAFIELIKSDSDYKESKMKEAAVNKEGGSGKMTSSSGTGNLSTTNNNKGPQEQMSLSDQMFAEYKKMMRERQKASMQRPKVFLTLDELARDDPVQTSLEEVKVPPPLFMADIQHLLLYSLQGIEASIKPRWCRLLRVGKVSKVVVAVLDSVSSEEFRKFPESLPTLEQAFDVHIDMVSPLQYGSSAREDLMNVPLSISQLKKQGHQDRKLNNNKKLTTKAKPAISRQKWSVIKTLRALVQNPLIPVEDATEGQKRKRESDKQDGLGNKRQKIEEKVDYNSIVSTYEWDQYDRRWLLLNSAQMILEGVPTPISATSSRYRGYRFSKETYKEVTEKSPLYALDCEMVQTVASKMDLARVSIIDENLDVVLDTFVKPWARVTNYVTQFSGITKEILDPVTTRLEDVQNMLQAHLPPDAILCGQSISSDLSSMKIFHPYIIDTSVIYNVSGERRFKTGLKRLSTIFLKRDIQCGNEGHSSVEDAQATMELVLLKLRNSMQFGDILMSDPNSMGLSIEEASPVLNSKCTAETSMIDPNNTTDIEDSCSVSMKSNHGNNSVNQNNTEADGDSAVNNVTQLDNQKPDTVSTDYISGTSETKILKQSASGVNENSKKLSSSNLTKTLPAASGMSAEVKQRRLFFQREGSNFMETFFQRIQKQKRIGAIVDESNSVPLYPQSMPVVISSDDRTAEKLTLDKIKDVGICFSHLYGYRNYLRDTKDCGEVDDEKTKACLWKLDRRFWKIMMGLPACSLFVVVLPGKEVNGQVHSAMAFAKIT